jgi:hypothetical protein
VVGAVKPVKPQHTQHIILNPSVANQYSVPLGELL